MSGRRMLQVVVPVVAHVVLAKRYVSICQFLTLIQKSRHSGTLRGMRAYIYLKLVQAQVKMYGGCVQKNVQRGVCMSGNLS